MATKILVTLLAAIDGREIDRFVVAKFPEQSVNHYFIFKTDRGLEVRVSDRVLWVAKEVVE